MIGLAAAVRRPERIARLVVFNTAAFPLPPGKTLPWEIAWCRKPGIGAWLTRGLNAFARGAARKCAVRRPLPPAVRAGYLAPYDSWANRIAVHRFVADIPLGPRDRSWPILTATAERLETLREIPMLICWGERDFVFDGSFLAEWERRFPEAQVHRVPGAGHYLLEDAGDEIIPRVVSFVTQAPGERP
jgi:haloalkane dehalogenase